MDINQKSPLLYMRVIKAMCFRMMAMCCLLSLLLCRCDELTTAEISSSEQPSTTPEISIPPKIAISHFVRSAQGGRDHMEDEYAILGQGRSTLSWRSPSCSGARDLWRE